MKIKPMFAELGTMDVLKNKRYIFEPKMDGIRIILKRHNRRVQLFNRLGKEVTSRYKHLNLGSVLRASSTVDGELVVYDKQGNPDFSLMQQSRSDKSIMPTYVVFDVLEARGKDVTSKPLLERKKLLELVINPNDRTQLMVYTSKGEKLWKWIKRRKGEGVVAKLIGSPYVQRRSNSWLKIKTTQSIDAAIIGYSTEKKSLALGLKTGDGWTHIGNVGSGLKDADYFKLIKCLRPQQWTMVLPSSIKPVKPAMVCEVEFLQVTKGNKLRAPVFLHLRADKTSEECTIDQLPNYGKEVIFGKLLLLSLINTHISCIL